MQYEKKLILPSSEDGQDDGCSTSKFQRHHISELPQWREIWQELYGFKNYVFQTDGSGSLRGYANLIRIKSPFFGDMLVTCPFFGYGGFHAESPKAEAELIQQILDCGRSIDVDYAELRLDHKLNQPSGINRHFSEFQLSLSDDVSQLWENSFSSNVRQNIRKSQRHGFRYQSVPDITAGAELLSRTMRNHGTPFHGRRFFQLVKKHFGENAIFSAVYHGNEIIAGGLVLTHDSRLYTPYIGSLEPHRRAGANYYLYWNIIQEAVKSGITVFDFGRSPVESTHARFKQKWGCRPIPVYYHCLKMRADSRYRSAATPTGMQRTATRVWRHLPLSMTRALGHLFFRYIP